MDSNEEDIETSLEQYKSQLEQLEQIPEHEFSDDLTQLKVDILEVIRLTEESLISLKRSKLLSSVDVVQDLPQECNKSEAVNTGCSSQVEDEQNGIIGTKCRVPFIHDWGEMSYHNAIIFNIETSDDGIEMANLLFCNPTHNSMLLCEHYVRGFCRYDCNDCKFSHGYLVPISDLKPFEEPNHENVLVGEKCLAKDHGSLWHKATIVDIMKEGVQVMFDSDNHLAIKELEDIHPLVRHDNDSDSDESMSDDNGESYHVAEKNSVKITDITIQTTDMLGQWEKHTKGIGSKLMLKMGYVIGEGLGKNSDGMALPVPIEILPQGKSLDKIMELREKSKNAFKPNFKVKPNHNKADHKKPKTVFDLLNHQFSTSGKTKSDHKSKSVHHISTEDLSKKSEKHINIQLMKTEEELKRTNHELYKLKDSQARSVERGDVVTAKRYEAKIINLKEYQDQLRASEKIMNIQKKSRKAHKDLVNF